MSHTVTIQTRVTNLAALRAAAAKQNARVQESNACQVHRLYDGEHFGFAVHLPHWHYPVVVNPETGEVKADTYGGKWGDQKLLDKLLQDYAVEVVKAEAARNHQFVIEHQLEDGSVELEIQELWSTL